jgi:hypothetical protein
MVHIGLKISGYVLFSLISVYTIMSNVIVSAGAPVIKGPEIIHFHSGFEKGNVSEWIFDYNGNHTGGGYVTNELSHSGSFSWKAYNDPELPGIYRISAKLLRWRFDHKEAYYSAWFYWPSNYRVSGIANQYVNFFQWKERTRPYDPTWIIVVYGGWGVDQIGIHDWKRKIIHRKGIHVPKGRWFHVEAYMRAGHRDGKLIVWLDGKEIYRFNNINILGSHKNPSYLMWGVGNYGEPGVGKHIYVDDVIVSTYRIGPEYKHE